MEMTVYERIKAALEVKSLSVNALAKRINVAQATLNPQLKGDRTLAANIVEKILIDLPDVSAEWLMRGKGDMLITEHDNLAKMQDYIDGENTTTPIRVADDSIWQAKYEELEKRYDQLLAILGGKVK